LKRIDCGDNAKQAVMHSCHLGGIFRRANIRGILGDVRGGPCGIFRWRVGPIFHGELQDMRVRIPMQDHKSLRVAFVIWDTLHG